MNTTTYKLDFCEKIELKKHISAIHCSNSLSLLQRKISNVLLFHAYPFLKTQQEHKISINELCKYLGYRGYNYDAIKQALKALISTVIEWNVFDDNLDEEDWTASSMLASVNIKNAVCTYSYSFRMKQLLHSPVMYGRINLAIQSRFTSNYGLALYENCSRYRRLGKTRNFSIEQFRKIMGVSNDKYLIFRDFKKRVVDKAVEEINTASDLNVEANINRVGKEVVSIYFNIFEKMVKKDIVQNNTIFSNQLKNNHSSEIINDANNSNLVKRLKESYFLSDKAIASLVKKYGLDKLGSKMEQIETSQYFIAGKILNAAGFLIESLKNDYELPKSTSLIIEEKTRARDKENYEVKKMDLERNKLKKEYDEYIDNQFNEFISNIEEDNLNNLLLQFEKYLCIKNNKLLLSKFKTHGLNSRIVRVFLRNFLQEFPQQYILDFISFDQFISSKANSVTES